MLLVSYVTNSILMITLQLIWMKDITITLTRYIIRYGFLDFHDTLSIPFWCSCSILSIV
jgi:hypothetical protein